MYGNYLNLYSIFKLAILYIFFVRNYWTNSEYIKHPEFLNQTYSGYKKILNKFRTIFFFFNYARAGKFYLLSIRGTKVQTLPYKTRKINLNPIGQVNIL